MDIGKTMDCDDFKAIAEELNIHELSAWVLQKHDPKTSIVKPVYLYDHSGISLHFYEVDLWDTGLLGIVFATPDDIKECHQVQTITEDVMTKCHDLVHSEVKRYSAWCGGHSLIVSIREGEDGDSCLYEFLDRDEMDEHIKTEWGEEALKNMIFGTPCFGCDHVKYRDQEGNLVTPHQTR